MSIHTRVKEIAETLGFRYFFGDWTSANLIADNWNTDNTPVMVDVLPVSGTFNIFRGELVGDSPQVMWAFLRRVPTDEVAGVRSEKRADIINACKSDWLNFLRVYNSTEGVEPITGEIPYNVIVEQFDEMYCGIMVTLTASLSQDMCLL